MATVQKWGGSLGVRIPSNIAKNFKINDGTQVEVKEVDGVIIIKPIYEEPSLDEMLEQITPENLHESTDIEAVGKERL
ncbi:AbrB/MazE/SpoVT family DNA-binding domain-containing protein [Marinococcus halotolerans]|uniref:AbrB/MazE/SpoVT family DNA-binding domain-containing protein n=1 Tax=Marinococcus halotolerans TaxID=301092 RepID=UPI0004090D41|nr:AbrB/MazE/SpoVT family DNA-binding domain-containing protein [Marinococcus halotolerans]